MRRRILKTDNPEELEEKITEFQEQLEETEDGGRETYLETKINELETYIRELESGVSQEGLQTRLEDLKGEAITRGTDEPTETELRTAGAHDAVYIVLGTYFSTEVEIEDPELVAATDDKIFLQGNEEELTIRLTSEDQARILADSILMAVGLEEEAARIGQR